MSLPALDADKNGPQKRKDRLLSPASTSENS